MFEKKRWILLGIIFCLLSGLIIFTKINVKEKDTLVIYTPNTDDLIKAVVPLFEEKYGIKVQIKRDCTVNLLELLKKEKDMPNADVLFGRSYITHLGNKELFMNYVSSNDSKIKKDYRNSTGYITPYALDGTVLIVNQNRLKNISVKSYKDLLKPELKNKIVAADPMNSSSACTQILAIVEAYGGADSPKAWDYLDKLYSKMNLKSVKTSEEVYKAVAEGEEAAGLTYEEPVIKLLEEGVDIEAVYPEEGSIFMAGSASIIKNAPHKKRAKQFIDFITSKKIQKLLSKVTCIRPVCEESKLYHNMKPLKDIKIIHTDDKKILKEKNQIKEHLIKLMKKRKKVRRGNFEKKISGGNTWKIGKWYP